MCRSCTAFFHKEVIFNEFHRCRPSMALLQDLSLQRDRYSYSAAVHACGRAHFWQQVHLSLNIRDLWLGILQPWYSQYASNCQHHSFLYTEVIFHSIIHRRKVNVASYCHKMTEAAILEKPRRCPSVLKITG